MSIVAWIALGLVGGAVAGWLWGTRRSALVGHAIRESVRASGLPEGVFSMLFDAGVEVGIQLVKHPVIKAVAFTGSFAGGTALMKFAAARPEMYTPARCTRKRRKARVRRPYWSAAAILRAVKELRQPLFPALLSNGRTRTNEIWRFEKRTASSAPSQNLDTHTKK